MVVRKRIIEPLLRTDESVERHVKKPKMGLYRRQASSDWGLRLRRRLLLAKGVVCRLTWHDGRGSEEVFVVVDMLLL